MGDSSDRVSYANFAGPPWFHLNAAWLNRQHAWSQRTFGPGARTEGVLAHIAKELDEVRADPADITEWVDVLILAFDGAMRAGFSPQEILNAYRDKLITNEHRQWPDWTDFSEGEPIEHIRP